MIDSFEPTNTIYENPILGFRLEYPPYWKVNEEADNNKAIFILPSETRASLIIQTFDSYKNTLDDIISRNLTSYKNSFLNFTLGGNRTLSIGNNRFQIINYSYGDGRNTFNVTDAWMQKDNKIHRITFKTDSTKKYLSYWPYLQKIISSFKDVAFIPYENLELGMRTIYPSTWNKTESNNGISFFSQKAPFRFSISSDVNSELTPINMTASIISKFRTNNLGFPQFQSVVTPKPIQLENINNPVYVFDYSFTSPDTGITNNNTEFMTLQNGRTYSILYAAPENIYSKYFPAINKTIQSIKLFNTSRYEKLFDDKNSGIMLKYPFKYPWKPTEVSNTKVNLIEDPQMQFSISVFPYAKGLESLEGELIDNYTRNKPYFINNTTADNAEGKSYFLKNITNTTIASDIGQ